MLSISGLVTTVILAVTATSLYSFWDLFREPKCDFAPSSCLTYFLKSRPTVQLAVFSSNSRNPLDFGHKRLVMSSNPFDYERDFVQHVNVSLKQPFKSKNSFLHVFILPPEASVKKWDDVLKCKFHVLTSIPLLKHQTPSATTFELLKGGNGTHNDASPVLHIKKSVTFTLIVGMNEIPLSPVPPELKGFVRNYQGMQLPIMHNNVLQERLSDLTPVVNETSIVELHYRPSSTGQFRLMIHFEEAFVGLSEYGFSNKDIDQMKGLFGGTHFYLLLITIIVSTLHLIFDFLALKSDVVFWKDRSSLAGISPRTVLWRAVSQTIILVYLFDETTSYLVLIPAAVTTVVEWWKAHKMYSSYLWSKTPRQESREEIITKELDAEGMKYLYYLCVPLCLSGAWYSLMYVPHKGWYSWVIQSFANGVYAFGFLLMLPQLFINYKLKSVDHMPWKKFMYKALNTFIDDLFAFLIEMPTTHRLACLRDDVVFFVYLYQRWLYPVDKKRSANGSESDEKEGVTKEISLKNHQLASFDVIKSQ